VGGLRHSPRPLRRESAQKRPSSRTAGAPPWDVCAQSRRTRATFARSLGVHELGPDRIIKSNPARQPAKPSSCASCWRVARGCLRCWDSPPEACALQRPTHLDARAGDRVPSASPALRMICQFPDCRRPSPWLGSRSRPGCCARCGDGWAIRDLTPARSTRCS
jgi:hypothetical protein